MRVQLIEEPLDDNEIEITRHIAELQREYQQRAQPLIDALARSRATKIRRQVLLLEPGDELPTWDGELGPCSFPKGAPGP